MLKRVLEAVVELEFRMTVKKRGPLGSELAVPAYSVELLGHETAFRLDYAEVTLLNFIPDTESLSADVHSSRLLPLPTSMLSKLFFPIQVILLADVLRVILAC